MVESNEKRNVVLGVTGSIAAYKSVELARLMVSRGYDVRTVMTRSAQEFITPLLMETITGNPVVVDFWEGTGEVSIEHIKLADWADVLVVAPATADLLAKLAAGIADTPLLALALTVRVPILIAPAMNVNMLEHPVTQRNIELLRERGVRFVDPEEGFLACGTKGAGRLSDPWEIFHEVRRAATTFDLNDKHVVITTGPTREAIDPVRSITNRSSGKMGVALAREAFRRGADVTLIHGPVYVKVPKDVRCVPVVTALEMQDAVMEHVFNPEKPADVVIMAAAVADFRPAKVSETKIKKSESITSIELEKNPDILAELGKRRGDNTSPKLVGFAVETGEMDDLMEEARTKLQDKKADMIVGNFAEDAFDLDTNRVWIVDRTGGRSEVATSYKSRVANKIYDSLVRLF